MPDKPISPLRHLPPEWREHPKFMRAELDDLQDWRAEVQSRPSNSATEPHSKQSILSISVVRPMILSLLLLTAIGVIPMEKAIKWIALLIRLSIG